jgi:hypothetical protein
VLEYWNIGHKLAKDLNPFKNVLQEMLIASARSAMSPAVREQERKLTHTVLAIVCCFTLTQGPSAIVFIYHLVYTPTLYVYTFLLAFHKILF